LAARNLDPVTVGAPAPSPQTPATKPRDPVPDRPTTREPAPPAAAAKQAPSKVAASARDVSVCVLSLDNGLVEAVRRSSAGRVSTVARMTDLIARIEAGDCCIAILDTSVIGDRLAKCIAELDRYSNRVVTLAAADRRDADKLVGHLSDRKIHRLLIKPPAAGITRLLLESAVGRYLQLLGRPGAELDATGTHFAPVLPRAPKLDRRWIAAAASLLVAATIGGLAWLLWPDAPAAGDGVGADAASPAASPAVSISQPIERFADLVAAAERAVGDGRLAEPVGDNALDYYLTILAADPMHALAQSRLELVVQALFTRAESAMLDNELDGAGAILAHLRRADPGSPRLAFLEAQLEHARRDTVPPAAAGALAATEAAETPAPSAAPTELESLVAIAQARIARGRLLDPPGDGASHYLERAALVDDADPRVLAASADLVTALAAGARAALREGDVDAANRMLEQAQRFGGRANVARLAADVAAARDAQLLARARERLDAGALVAPEDDSALHYLTLLGRDPGNAADASAAWTDLANALSAQAERALGVRDWAAGESAVAALERAGGNTQAVASLRRALVVGRTQERYLATASPAGELTVVSYSLPEYPADARQRGIEGWVEVEFVVDITGSTREVTPVASEPAGRFERAAVEAVSAYRYEPFALDGQLYERRARLRIRFDLL
jgi:protein TonB